MQLQTSNYSRCHIINGENAAQTQWSEGFQAQLFISEITVPFQDLGPSYMVSGTGDNPYPEVTLSSVYM